MGISFLDSGGAFVAVVFTGCVAAFLGAVGAAVGSGLGQVGELFFVGDVFVEGGRREWCVTVGAAGSLGAVQVAAGLTDSPYRFAADAAEVDLLAVEH